VPDVPPPRVTYKDPITRLSAETIRVADRFDTEPVIGWRAWNVLEVLEFVALSSITYSNVHWPKRAALLATCQKPNNKCGLCPTVECVCGVYARSGESEEWYRKWSQRGNAHTPRCWGSVYLWGHVILHEDGWRGQRAYPRELFVTRGVYADDVLLKLEDGYGVTVNEIAPDSEEPS